MRYDVVVCAAAQGACASQGVCGYGMGVCGQRDVAVLTAWRWVFCFVIPRAVAESSTPPGLRAFYRHFWMLRLRAA